ncbi:MAG TPA: tRNA pseudouridine(55) synthase TruB, partial [Nevskiaceae bacterium]|nr:tRNA pseudouridine(55) synthase TruB [Nevskiaceae bacterium]
MTSFDAQPGRHEVDGVLLLDKPTGTTSNAALQRAKRAYRALKAGHTGSLDPLATGVLPICFGKATRLAAELLDADKAYRATV